MGMTNRLALLIEAIMTAVGFILLAIVNGSKSFMVLFPGLVLVGAGVVICSIPFGNLVVKGAPPEQFGPVTSSRTTAGQFFYSIGFAISTVIIDKLTVGGVVDNLATAGVPPTQTGTAVSAVSVYASTGTEPSTALGRQSLADAVQSYGGAFTMMMIIAAVVAVVGGVVGYLLLLKAGEGSKDPVPAGPATA